MWCYADKQAVVILLYETLLNLHPSKLLAPEVAIFHTNHKGTAGPLSPDPCSLDTLCGKRSCSSNSLPVSDDYILSHYISPYFNTADFHFQSHCFVSLICQAVPLTWQSCYNLYIICILIPAVLWDPSDRKLPQYTILSFVFKVTFKSNRIQFSPDVYPNCCKSLVSRDPEGTGFLRDFQHCVLNTNSDKLPYHPVTVITWDANNIHYFCRAL